MTRVGFGSGSGRGWKLHIVKQLRILFCECDVQLYSLRKILHPAVRIFLLHFIQQAAAGVGEQVGVLLLFAIERLIEQIKERLIPIAVPCGEVNVISD